MAAPANLKDIDLYDDISGLNCRVKQHYDYDREQICSGHSEKQVICAAAHNMKKHQGGKRNDVLSDVSSF